MDFGTDNHLVRQLLAGELFLHVDAAGKIVPKGHKTVAEVFWVRDQGKPVKIFNHGLPIDAAVEDMIKVLRQRWEADKAAHEAAMAAAAPAEAAVNETAGMQVVAPGGPSRSSPRPSPMPASAQPMPMPMPIILATDGQCESNERRDSEPVAMSSSRETESNSSPAGAPTLSTSPIEEPPPPAVSAPSPPAATAPVPTPMPAGATLPAPADEVSLFKLEPPSPLPPVNKGGRPRLHAWDEAAVALAVYVFRSLPSYPPTENQCRSYIRKWFEATSEHVPVESEIGGLVKRFLPMLREARQDVKDKFLAQNLKS